MVPTIPEGQDDYVPSTLEEAEFFTHWNSATLFLKIALFYSVIIIFL